MGRAKRRGGSIDVDFSSLLCESQGMVTINILYSLKPSKNTILGGGAHFLSAPPQYIQAGCVMPGAAYIYIFINTGLYNEMRPCQEQHFLLVFGPDAWEMEQSSHSHAQWHGAGSHNSFYTCHVYIHMHGDQRTLSFLLIFDVYFQVSLIYRKTTFGKCLIFSHSGLSEISGGKVLVSSAAD